MKSQLKGGNMNLIKNKQEKIKSESFWNCFLKKSTFKKIKIGYSLNKRHFSNQSGQKNKIDNKKYKNKITQKENHLLSNKKGQGLIEYLILIALMGVATIGIIRTLNQTVKSRFANAIYALQGRNQKAKTHAMKKGEYQRSDLSNFMSGSASTDKKTKNRR